jgi:hypothetical protein
MILGTSQIDITLKPGAELSGFAARVQPSIGVLESLLPRIKVGRNRAFKHKLKPRGEAW